jgi:hypothetical protein
MVALCYVGACAVFTLVTFLDRGARLPSALVFLTFLTGLALAWTLDVLTRYAADTKRTAVANESAARTAIEQTRNFQRPLIVFEFTPRPFTVGVGFEHATESKASMAFLSHALRMRNIGGGPAYDVRLKSRSKGATAWDIRRPHMEVGADWSNAGITAANLDKSENVFLLIEYSGLVGRFRSTYELRPTSAEYVIESLVVAPIEPGDD